MFLGVPKRKNIWNTSYENPQNNGFNNICIKLTGDDKKPKIKIYNTVILPVVLYGCETWSFTLREEQRPRVFQKRVLRGIFGPKIGGRRIMEKTA
jgi:hypothetical protein